MNPWLPDDPPVCVIGLGNLLQRDDGFGPRAVQWLEQRYEPHEALELVDAGTAGLHVVRWVVGRRAVLFLDALSGDGSPGELRTFGREALFAVPPPGPRVSPHQPDVGELLRLADVAGGAPARALLIGAFPETLDQGDELSPAVEAALPVAGRLVARELARLGIELRPRAPVAAGS